MSKLYASVLVKRLFGKTSRMVFVKKWRSYDVLKTGKYNKI